MPCLLFAWFLFGTGWTDGLHMHMPPACHHPMAACSLSVPGDLVSQRLWLICNMLSLLCVFTPFYFDWDGLVSVNKMGDSFLEISSPPLIIIFIIHLMKKKRKVLFDHLETFSFHSIFFGSFLSWFLFGEFLVVFTFSVGSGSSLSYLSLPSLPPTSPYYYTTLPSTLPTTINTCLHLPVLYVLLVHLLLSSLPLLPSSAAMHAGGEGRLQALLHTGMPAFYLPLPHTCLHALVPL